MTSNARWDPTPVFFELLGVDTWAVPPPGIASISWVLKVIYIFLKTRGNMNNYFSIEKSFNIFLSLLRES